MHSQFMKVVITKVNKFTIDDNLSLNDGVTNLYVIGIFIIYSNFYALLNSALKIGI